MKRKIKDMCASVRAKLQNFAMETNRPFAEILQYYGMERFLYRLSISEYADNFVLKGALLFIAWKIPERRVTLDIDFLAQYDNEVASIEKVMKDVCNVSASPDGLVFSSQTVKGMQVKKDAYYEGVRIKLTGFLGNSRIPMQIDIGFGDVIYPEIPRIDYPVILDFPKPQLKGYPRESVVSEKFEAMIKLGLLNSRMKDFYDIWIMMRQFEFAGTNLVKAMNKTFKNRKTDIPAGRPLFADEIYDVLSDRQVLWKAFLKKNDVVCAPETLAETAQGIEIFLFPPVSAAQKGDRFCKNWYPADGWV